MSLNILGSEVDCKWTGVDQVEFCRQTGWELQAGDLDGIWAGLNGGVLAQRAHSTHSTDMTRRNWGWGLQLAIFLPKQTILHPHNVGQPHVSPHTNHHH